MFCNRVDRVERVAGGIGFFTRIPQPKAVRSAEALAGVSSREVENKIVLIKVVKTLCFMSYE